MAKLVEVSEKGDVRAVNITDRAHLGYNELGVLGALERQLLGDVGQRNARVAETDHANAGLDDIVTQAGSPKNKM